MLLFREVIRMNDEYTRRGLMKTTGAAIVGGAGLSAASGTASAHSIGASVFTNTNLNVRTGPGLGYGIIETADQYTGMRIIDGPWSADGYTWWKHEVNGDADHGDRYTGYAVQQYTDMADFVYPANGQIVSTYWSSRDGGSRSHRAIDIAGDYGSSIRAAADGTIRQINDQGDSGCGLYLEMDHGGSYITRYCHLSDVDVSVGQWVNSGDHIAKMGNSGCNCITHVHFKIMRYDDCHTCAKNWPMTAGAWVYDRTGIEKNFPGI